METIGLGAGSYPEAPEPKEKIFRFKFEGSCLGEGIVYAKNEREARNLIECGEYEVEDIEVNEIFDVKDIEEEI